ncbi:DUF6056 family protein [Helicobacter himalayensis]|uniref:DUF6056 family protein n=1 Tax=Helicobacter himalayensis TaxID=1591088 RepID=UPI003D6FB28D
MPPPLIGFLSKCKIFFKNPFDSQNSCFSPLFSSIAIFLGLYVFLLFVNVMFPVQSDDLGHTTTNFQAAISSYMGWNGRIGDMARVWFGSYLATMSVFNFINAFVGVGVLYLFFTLLFGRLPKGGIETATIFAGMMFLILFDSAFGAIFYWAAGSFNYLWAYFVILLWLLPYRIFWGRVLVQANTQSAKESFLAQSLKSLGMLFLGIVAGWASELNAVIIIVLLASLVISWRKKITLPFWYFSGGLGFLAGFLVLYFSPGSARRAALFRGWGAYFTLKDLWDMSFSQKIERIKFIFSKVDNTYFNIALCVSVVIYAFTRFHKILLSLCVAVAGLVAINVVFTYAHSVLFLSFCAIIGFLLFLDSKKARLQDEAKFFLILTLAILFYMLYISATIQILIPHRAQLHYTLIKIALLVSLLVYLRTKCECKIMQYLYKVASIALFVCGIVYGAYVAKECYSMHNKWQQMVGFIEGQKALGNKNIAVSSKYFKSNYKYYTGWQNPDSDPNSWPNPTYAKYFGLDSFIVK